MTETTLLTANRQGFTRIFAWARRPLAGVVLGLSLFGCATQRATIEPETAAPAQVNTPQTPSKIADRPFEAETLYALLVAEMAGDRNRFDIMLGNYVQQATRTRDPEVTARASRIARFLNAHQASLDMALLWVELEPQNSEAHYNAAAELVHADRLLEAFDHSRFLLEQGETSGFDAIGAKAVQGDMATTTELISRYRELTAKYPESTELLVGTSLLLQQTGDLSGALQASQQALALEPNNFQAAIQETRVLQQIGDSEQALKRLKSLVDDNPDNVRLRLQYARSLTQSNLGLAQEQFEILDQQTPLDPDISLTLALIQYERGLLQEAKQRLNELLERQQHVSAAHFYLGSIARAQEQVDQAFHHFSAVPSGPDFLPAMSQLTELLVESDRSMEARELLQAKRAAAKPEDAEGLYVLEATVLSTAGHYPAAEQLLTEGLQHHQSSTQILYARAMLFSHLDQISAAEQDFRRIIELSPDNATALNALGYTLADRTERLDEAYQYISRALALEPNDPAIMDSMGWVQYRLGNYPEALTQLREALKTMPDPEIAAHLGEVLWVTGVREEARRVWREGLNLSPDSKIILQTIQRLGADLERANREK